MFLYLAILMIIFGKFVFLVQDDFFNELPKESDNYKNKMALL